MIFFVQKCADFQEVCYSTARFVSDALKLEPWILVALHRICSWDVLMKNMFLKNKFLQLSAFYMFLSTIFIVNIKLKQLSFTVKQLENLTF